MIASESAIKSSLELGVDLRILSRSVSDEPKKNAFAGQRSALLISTKIRSDGVTGGYTTHP